MRAIIPVQSLSCWLALALVAPSAIAATPAGSPHASAGPLQGGTPTYSRKLAADLKFLQGQRAAMEQKRQALEAELARVRTTGDTKRAAELPVSIEVMRRKVESVDRQIHTVNDRIKALPNLGAPAAGSKALPAQPARKKLVDPATTFKPVRAAAKKKIQAAARQFALNPNPSMAAARSAASELMAANPVDFSGMPVEDAIMLMFQIITEDARKDLKDTLSEMDRKRRSATPPPHDTAKPGKGAKSAPEKNDISEADQRRIDLMLARKSQLEQLLSEATKKSSETNGRILENTK